MLCKKLLTGIVVGVVMGMMFSAAVVLAGSLEPIVGSTQPGSQMYTLEQIYDRINNGAAATKMTTFTEPSSGPTAGTMHTLDEIYNLVGVRAPVPRTGQNPTVPVNPAPAGSDGALSKGVAWPNPRFTENGNGTVTDNLTGLIWLQDANCTNFFSGDIIGLNDRSWDDARSAANSLASGKCNLNDGSNAGQWRLPNMRELQSLIDYGRINPALPVSHPFTSVWHGSYWTGSPFAMDTLSAWSVNLQSGQMVQDNKTAHFHIWPVRGGQ
jgi:hypothetical protein